MAKAFLGEPIDPAFPNYAYAAKALVKVFAQPTGSTRVANLFLGEWMKVLDEELREENRVHVRYRGGQGFVALDDLTRRRHLEIYFLDIGQGDAILIQTPEDRRILIDGGKSNAAYGFIYNKYRLDKPTNYIDFDAIVATHSDEDHAKGLIKILTDPKIAVKRFYHNGLFRRADDAQDPGPRDGAYVSGLFDRPKATDTPPLKPFMKDLIAALAKAEKNLPVTLQKMVDLKRRVDAPPEGFVCKRLDAADGFLPPYDDPAGRLAIEVLWPRAVLRNGRASYPWYGDAGKTVNGNSVVLRVRYGTRRILLAGDLNTASMDDLLDAYPAAPDMPHPLVSDVYKAAHHGSQDFSLPFLRTVQPNAAVISSGDDKDDEYGHPRAVLMGTVTRYSCCEKPAVFSTELAACYKPLSQEQRQQFKAGNAQLYERSYQGVIHLRSNGDDLYLGSVFGRKAPGGSKSGSEPKPDTLWKWDIWPDD